MTTRPHLTFSSSENCSFNNKYVYIYTHASKSSRPYWIIVASPSFELKIFVSDNKTSRVLYPSRLLLFSAPDRKDQNYVYEVKKTRANIVTIRNRFACAYKRRDDRVPFSGKLYIYMYVCICIKTVIITVIQ